MLPSQQAQDKGSAKLQCPICGTFLLATVQHNPAVQHERPDAAMEGGSNRRSALRCLTAALFVLSITGKTSCPALFSLSVFCLQKWADLDIWGCCRTHQRRCHRPC